MAEVKPSPFELWQQAGGNAEEYRRLMREHGHLVPGNPGPLPCGWPGRRADDEDSRAGATPVAGLGDEGVLLELARGRPATEAEPSAGLRGTAPGGGTDPRRPGQPPCRRVGQAGDAGPPSIPLGGGPAGAPVPDAEGLGATGTGPGPEGAARSSAAAPSAGLPGTRRGRRGARPELIMRVLAAHSGPLSTPRLVDLAGEGLPSRHKALNWYGNLLRSGENHGRVKRGPLVPGGFQRPPQVTWAITPAGREWLAGRSAVRAAREAAREKAQALRAARAAAPVRIAEASGVYGPGTAKPDRRRVIGELRDAGCTLAQIGSVFGVSRQEIHYELGVLAGRRRSR